MMCVPVAGRAAGLPPVETSGLHATSNSPATPSNSFTILLVLVLESPCPARSLTLAALFDPKIIDEC
jgi:hypothetical protein